MSVVAEPALISRSALQKIEAGDTGLLQALGPLAGLNQVADIRNDSLGQSLATASYILIREIAGSLSG